MTLRRHWHLIAAGCLLALVAGCGSSENVTPPPVDDNTFAGAGLGRSETLEVVTWNVENFAKNGTATVEYVRDAVEAMGADVVAFQEISQAFRFDELNASLEGWQGHRAVSDRYLNLAFLYREDSGLEVESIYEILAGDDAFPRTPLVLQGLFDGVPIRIVNNHYKCCGDGAIDPDSYWDEEYRRQRASAALEQHIRTNWPDERVIVAGDLNDAITDAPERNVFQVFLDAPESYRFVDMAIAAGPSSGWSFPNFPSHLDHILITAPLFAAADDPSFLVQVVPLHTYLARGFIEYDANISDHLPVALRIALD